MDVLAALGRTLIKMFAADIALTGSAVVAVIACAILLKTGVIGPFAIPLILAAAILAALAWAVLRAAARSGAQGK
ncbi:MAG: hypothetical protein ACRED8_03640 [Caulobacteraceae bacterium]